LRGVRKADNGSNLFPLYFTMQQKGLLRYARNDFAQASIKPDLKQKCPAFITQGIHFRF
jgi:hypothetical protein